MLPRRIPGSRPPNHRNSFTAGLLRTLERSCRSFCNTLPLFSTACALFSQNTRGGDIPPTSLSTAHKSQVTLLPALCFHSVTNRFSRKLKFTSIRIAPGCHPPAFLFNDFCLPVSVPAPAPTQSACQGLCSQQLAASCSLLPLFFALLPFVFSGLQPLFPKYRGVG
jgi:hypothetical protein